MSFGKANIGASYHTYTPGDEMHTAGIKKGSGMILSAGYALGSFSINGDFETQELTPKTGTATKNTYMSVNFWGTKGTFRPGAEFASSKSDAAGSSTNETDATAIAAGVKYHPEAWGSTNGYAKYYSYGCKKGGNANTCTDKDHTKIMVGINSSLTIL